MKRLARVLAQKEGALIDLHSWNHFTPRAGMTSSVYLYMELLPYIQRAWLDEGFHYDAASPEYWLIEMSGIPFGVMAEMLQDGGNVYRGMVFGEVTRLGWTETNPEPLWELWDSFGITESKMLGWWDERCPVKADRSDVKVTCYQKEETLLIAAASWAEEPVAVRFQICQGRREKEEKRRLKKVGYGRQQCRLILVLLKQGIDNFMFLLHKFLAFFEAVAFAFDVDHRTMVQNPVKNC